MKDLYLASAVSLAVSAAAALMAWRLARRRRRVAVGLVAVAVALLALHVAYGRHSLRPALWMPWSNMIILADPHPLLVAIIVGGGAGLVPGHPLRRAMLLLPLAALCLWNTFGPLFTPVPRLGNHWHRGVCRQTSNSSCAPAAGATLLAVRGIRTTEQEMARLSLTNDAGTQLRGLWRGLILKTEGTPFKPQPYWGDIDSLRTAPMPLLLTVRLDPKRPHDPRYSSHWGWAPNVPHTVVLYAVTPDGRYINGDPAVGRELWRREALETLWHGEAIALVQR